MATCYRFTLSAHTVVDSLGHFSRQVDLLNTHVNHFDAQCRHTVRVDDRYFTVRFSLNTFSRFGNRAICCRSRHFIFRASRTGVQRVTDFQGQTTAGIRELTFQQDFRLRNIATARCQVVTAKVTDAPLNVGVNDQIFLLFGNKAIGLVVHGLNTRIEHLHRFNKRNLEVQAWCNDQRLVFIVTQNFTKAQSNTALAFFDHKDRHEQNYQNDDDNRNN